MKWLRFCRGHLLLRKARQRRSSSPNRSKCRRVLRDGDAIPDGVDPERVIIVVRTYVDPPVREDEELPVQQAEHSVESQHEQRRQPLEYPNLGLT
jgi:hypothetical protein